MSSKLERHALAEQARHSVGRPGAHSSEIERSEIELERETGLGAPSTKHRVEFVYRFATEMRQRVGRPLQAGPLSG